MSASETMIAAATAPRRPEAGRADPLAARARLLDSASWWAAKARHEALPADRLWACFSCAACGSVFDRVFVCPEPGEAPLYRSPDEIERLLEPSTLPRSPLVADAWEAASRCECGAPGHHVALSGSALFHAVLGSGAGLVVERLGGESRWLRVQDGSGALEPIEPESFRSLFGRPLTLFDAWSDVASKLPVDSDSVVGSGVEPGVWLFAARSARNLELGIRGKLGARPLILVRLEPATVRGAAWPGPLSSLADALEGGTAAALVIERDAMLSQARTWARGRLGADVGVEEQRWLLATDMGHWSLAPNRIALDMVRAGRTLPEAVASELNAAARAIEDRIATLAALVERMPGASFEVEGLRATARLADGRAVRTIELAQLPAGAQTLSEEVLAREAAFLFDAAPPWADRARVCPCGAALSLEARLVAWPWSDAASRPRVVRPWAEEGQPGAAEVVALCCDRHVRIPSEAELGQLGIDDATVAARLGADVARAKPRVHAYEARTEAGARVAIVRGPFISSVVLDDARARALHDALGEPLGGEGVVGWAIGSDLCALVSGQVANESLVGALFALGIPADEPFWLRRELDLSVPAQGSFEVVFADRPGRGSE